MSITLDPAQFNLDVCRRYLICAVEREPHCPLMPLIMLIQAARLHSEQRFQSPGLLARAILPRAQSLDPFLRARKVGNMDRKFTGALFLLLMAVAFATHVPSADAGRRSR